ncbi:MAG: TPM domain-containing protein [Pikeienuella sp.]
MRLQIFALLFALAPVVALGATLERSDLHVIDAANLLTSNDETNLHKKLADFQTDTGIEAVLVTINNLAENGGPAQPTHSDVIQFASRLLRDWGIGARDKNGVLILISKDDRKMRIHLGDHFGQRHDGRMQRIVDNMTGAFRNGRFAQGIFDGVGQVVENLAPRSNSSTKLSPIIAMVVIVVSFLVLKFRWQNRPKICPKCGVRVLSKHAKTDGHPGMSRVNYHCANCDHRESRWDVTAERRGMHSRNGIKLGGFGGGRGGSRGGGGASGGW